MFDRQCECIVSPLSKRLSDAGVGALNDIGLVIQLHVCHQGKRIWDRCSTGCGPLEVFSQEAEAMRPGCLRSDEMARRSGHR